MFLEDFEYAVYNRQYEDAGRLLVEILNKVDGNYGALPQDLHFRATADITDEQKLYVVVSRLTAAIGVLVIQPEFHINDIWKPQLLVWHRWLSAIFAAVPTHNADHFLRIFFNQPEAGIKKERADDSFQISLKNIYKFILLYTQESQIPLDVDTVWSVEPVIALSLGLSVLSSRFAGSETAHSKREAFLGWLPAKLLEYGTLERLPTGILHDAFMHCSYADRADKHEIKRSINRLVRRDLEKRGIVDLSFPLLNKNEIKASFDTKSKPVLFVVFEWFNSSHSIYRTHSAGLRALKKHFYVVGFGFEHMTDYVVHEVSDEFFLIPVNGVDLFGQINFIQEKARERQPQIILYPSIGMFPITIYMANLRLAPIQVTALGHGASSMSTCIDYFAVESDFIGDPKCFSEKLISLPTDSLPFVRSKLFPQNLHIDIEKKPPVVKVAVAATTMKYNPNFLRVCQRIAQGSKYPVVFQFFSGMSVGLVHAQLFWLIRRYIPTAVIHTHLGYSEYIQNLKQCDLFINPFPYGNMNGIADMLELHMVGVCLTGQQIHEKIDHGMFNRLGFPEWTVARNHDQYVTAALKLIEDHDLRYRLRQALKESKAAQVLYQGRPEILSERLFALVSAS